VPRRRELNGYEPGVSATAVSLCGGDQSAYEKGEPNMFSFIRILVLCTVAGFLLATVFMTPGGAAAGAVKGLLVGILIAWGERKSKRKEAAVSYVRH